MNNSGKIVYSIPSELFYPSRMDSEGKMSLFTIRMYIKVYILKKVSLNVYYSLPLKSNFYLLKRIVSSVGIILFQ